MSRLYIKTLSDLRKGTGKCAHQKAEAEVYWGSKENSRLAAYIVVKWPIGTEKPIVSIGKAEGLLD